MLDPNFSKSILVLLEWSDEGAFGLVLNRPTDVSVADHLPDWASLVAEPAVVHMGGPVQREIAIGLDVSKGRPPSLIDLAGDHPETLERLRVFAGYAGWGPGQLDFELEEQAWHLAGWRPEDLAAGLGDELWRTVIRRQPGSVAFESTFPDDLSVN